MTARLLVIQHGARPLSVTNSGDPTRAEEQLRALVLAALDAVVEEEKVPLSAEQRLRLMRDVEDDVLGHALDLVRRRLVPGAAGQLGSRRHRRASTVTST